MGGHNFRSGRIQIFKDVCLKYIGDEWRCPLISLLDTSSIVIRDVYDYFFFINIWKIQFYIVLK